MPTQFRIRSRSYARPRTKFVIKPLGARRRRKVFRMNRRHKRKFRKVGKSSKITTVKEKNTYGSDRTLCRMKYVEPTFILSLTGTAITKYNFSMTDLNDPYIGVGGGVPSGFGYMTTLYRTFLTHGAKITTTVTNANSSTDYEVEFCIVAYSDNAGSATTMETAREQPYSRFRAMTGTRGSASQATITSYMSLKKIQGLKNIRDNACYGESGSTPTLTPYFCIFLSSPQHITGTVELVIDVKITYYVEWFERLQSSSVFFDKLITYMRKKGLWDKIQAEMKALDPPCIDGNEEEKKRRQAEEKKLVISEDDDPPPTPRKKPFQGDIKKGKP